jgi:hypothetical protein
MTKRVNSMRSDSTDKTTTKQTPPKPPDLNGEAEQTPPNQAQPLSIPPEPAAADDRIVVGNGGVLGIPSEVIDAGDDAEEEPGTGVLKIRKPGRYEFVILDPARELRAVLLPYRAEGEQSMNEDLYWIDPKLRRAVKADLRDARVFPFYSTARKEFALWVVKISLDNSWYESLLDKVFRQPSEFFEQFEVKIVPDKDGGCYRVKKRPRTVMEVSWPARTVNKLLEEALGPGHIIRSADHEIYARLIEGEEVR